VNGVSSGFTPKENKLKLQIAWQFQVQNGEARKHPHYKPLKEK
jgi:hypothetical protein